MEQNKESNVIWQFHMCIYPPFPSYDTIMTFISQVFHYLMGHVIQPSPCPRDLAMADVSINPPHWQNAHSQDLLLVFSAKHDWKHKAADLFSHAAMIT